MPSLSGPTVPRCAGPFRSRQKLSSAYIIRFRLNVRSAYFARLLITGVSDNVGGVKHVATTLPHALEQERHFALIGEVLNPTKARFLISIQVGKLSSTHASLRSPARSSL